MTEWVLTEKQIEHLDDTTSELCIEGSAGSGKTIFACSKVLKYVLSYPGAQFGVFRQTLPALKKTAWKEIRKLLIKYDIEYRENKSDGEIHFPNGSMIMFASLDEDSKIRSLNLDGVYIEQAEEVSYIAYNELNLRIRSEVSAKYYGQMIIVVQPEGTDHWIYDYFHIQDDPERNWIHFSYKENPYLPERQRKIYDGYKQTDPELYRKYSEGKWGILTNLIFNGNYDYKESDNYEFYTAGIDFGFSAPAAFLLCGWNDEECYVIDEVYEAGLTNLEFIDQVKIMLAKNEIRIQDINMCYADAANPDKIQEFENAGFNIVPGVKNVEAKINSTKQTRIHIGKECMNTAWEIKNYKWQVNKDGVVLEVPVKVNDHAMDALCYNVYGVRGALSPDKPMTRYIGADEVSIY